jgi:hypothetical protein
MANVITLGWRERLAIPQFGIASLKAKLDSGARSSALHVESLETFERDGTTWLHFLVRTGRRGSVAVPCQAPAIGRRQVTDSGGHVTSRWFIVTELELAGRRFQAEVNLTDRRHMLFPLLLGRTALQGRVMIDPALSYTHSPSGTPIPARV